ncbi:MAG: hypothetical protein QOD39_159 [Mycobacterium sp.]|nr:hypothetical protein [Mycobacterium sp.]
MMGSRCVVSRVVPRARRDVSTQPWQPRESRKAGCSRTRRGHDACDAPAEARRARGYVPDCRHDLVATRVTTFPPGHPMAGRRWLALECRLCNAGCWNPLEGIADGEAAILAALDPFAARQE